MTTFKCSLCGSIWTEGATRDYNEEEVCRKCLKERIKLLEDSAFTLTEKIGAFTFIILFVISVTITISALIWMPANNWSVGSILFEAIALCGIPCAVDILRGNTGHWTDCMD